MVFGYFNGGNKNGNDRSSVSKTNQASRCIEYRFTTFIAAHYIANGNIVFPVCTPFLVEVISLC